MKALEVVNQIQAELDFADIVKIKLTSVRKVNETEYETFLRIMSEAQQWRIAESKK
jgi:hypothetical protein